MLGVIALGGQLNGAQRSPGSSGQSKRIAHGDEHLAVEAVLHAYVSGAGVACAELALHGYVIVTVGVYRRSVVLGGSGARLVPAGGVEASAAVGTRGVSKAYLRLAVDSDARVVEARRGRYRGIGIESPAGDGLRIARGLGLIRPRQRGNGHQPQRHHDRQQHCRDLSNAS